MSAKDVGKVSILETAFAPLLLVSIWLLTIVLEGAVSPAFGFGIAVGRASTSVAIALPIFLLLVYTTQSGRSSSLRKKLSIFCITASAVWIVQLLLLLALPNLSQQLTSKTAATSQQISAQQQLDQPKCKGYFDDILDSRCSRPAQGAALPLAPEKPKCKDPYEHLDKGANCAP